MTNPNGAESNGRAPASHEPPAELDRAAFLDYLTERRRAIITELRRIERLLGVPQSVPERKRPH